MKINFLQISNILSFKHYENIEEAPKISFNNDLNILIGQNGSGKSTALETINFILKKVLFVPINFNFEQFQLRESINSSGKRNILKIPDNKQCKNFRLAPNWDTESNSQKIKLEVELDDIDHENIRNIQTNKEKLKEVASTYAQISIPELQASNKKFIMEIDLNYIENKFSTSVSPGDSSDFYYLANYNFFKTLISLHNMKHSDSPIPILRESFVLIGGYRNYHTFNTKISLGNSTPAQQTQDLVDRENSKSVNENEQSEPPIFSLVKLKIAEGHYNDIVTKKDEQECERDANNSPILRLINDRLKLINLACRIKLIAQRTWEYNFYFFDVEKNRQLGDINNLSSGQKAITHLIFEAYGRGDLKGGLVLIDEPEIHLHYQFQNEYLHIIKEINKEQKCQYILATHSESLINANTISKVKRFYQDQDKHTFVKSSNLTTDQKTLIKILDNTRCTYAFFAKKIILVEGDTDRYFFKAVFDIIKPRLNQEIAILDIGGKGNHENWRSFFEAFGLTVYYIGDFDNVSSIKLSNDAMIEKSTIIETKIYLKQEKLNNLNSNETTKLQNAYSDLISSQDFLLHPQIKSWKPLLDIFIQLSKVDKKDIALKLKTDNPTINDKINEQYKKKIFILKNGSIEDYTKTAHGKLESMIDFCENKLQNWLNEKSPEAIEILEIIEKISTEGKSSDA